MTVLLRKGELGFILFGVSLAASMLLLIATGRIVSTTVEISLIAIFTIVTVLIALITLLSNNITAFLYKGRWYIGVKCGHAKFSLIPIWNSPLIPPYKGGKQIGLKRLI